MVETQRPIAAVGVVCLRGEDVLLVRRGAPPLEDRWSLPGGRIEWGERAADALGAEFRALDFGDYPLEIDRGRMDVLVDAIREFAPDVIVTHTDRDPFNPDHPAAFQAVERARALAAGAGVESAFETISPPQLFLVEPHQPELCNFTPTTFPHSVADVVGE